MADESEGLSEQELHFGYWYTTHKIGLKRVFTFVFAIVVIMLYVLVAYRVLDWAVLGGNTERKLTDSMVRSKVNSLAFNERNVPRDLAIEETHALTDGAPGKIDFLTLVKNPNAQWSAEITFQFTQGALQTKEQKGFVLPGDEKIIATYAITDATTETPNFKILSLHWLKVPPHEITKFDVWALERLNFQIDKLGNSLVDFGNKKIVRTSFTIKNASAFSYWNVPLQIALVRPGGDIAAIQEVILDRFVSGEMRTVDANWFYDVPVTAEPRVVPIVNLLDKSVYIPLLGE